MRKNASSFNKGVVGGLGAEMGLDGGRKKSPVKPGRGHRDKEQAIMGNVARGALMSIA
jgi:hypothetical protein